MLFFSYYYYGACSCLLDLHLQQALWKPDAALILVYDLIHHQHCQDICAHQLRVWFSRTRIFKDINSELCQKKIEWNLSPTIIMDLLGFHLGLYFIKQWPVADATVDPSSGSQYDKGIYCMCSALHSAYMYLLVGRWTWSRRMGRWSISTTPRSRPLLLPTHSPLLVTPKWNVRGICFVC